jgi:hypothetical protein
LKDFDGRCKNPSAVQRLTGKVLWMISISRNSIVVIIGMILVYIFESKGFKLFKITGMEFNHSNTFMFSTGPTVHKETLQRFWCSSYAVPKSSVLQHVAVGQRKIWYFNIEMYAPVARNFQCNFSF